MFFFNEIQSLCVESYSLILIWYQSIVAIAERLCIIGACVWIRESDRLARGLLDSQEVIQAVSATLQSASSGSTSDRLCHWRYDTFLSIHSAQRFAGPSNSRESAPLLPEICLNPLLKAPAGQSHFPLNLDPSPLQLCPASYDPDLQLVVLRRKSCCRGRLWRWCGARSSLDKAVVKSLVESGHETDLPEDVAQVKRRGLYFVNCWIWS